MAGQALLELRAGRARCTSVRWPKTPVIKPEMIWQGLRMVLCRSGTAAGVGGVWQPVPTHRRGLTVLKLGKRLSGDVPLSLKVRKCLMSKGG